MFRTKIVEKVKTNVLCSVIFFFFRKSYRVWGNEDKYGRVGEATDDNIIQRMRVTCWITKAADTHAEYVMFLFHGNKGTRTHFVHRLSCYLLLASQDYFHAFISYCYTWRSMFPLMVVTYQDTRKAISFFGVRGECLLHFVRNVWWRQRSVCVCGFIYGQQEVCFGK